MGIVVRIVVNRRDAITNHDSRSVAFESGMVVRLEGIEPPALRSGAPQGAVQEGPDRATCRGDPGHLREFVIPL
jgi:hypothetical protein